MSVLSAALLWGTIGPAQILAAGAVAPSALAGWRCLVGGLALAAVSGHQLAAFRRGGCGLWGAVAASGALGAAYQITFLTSVAWTGAAIGTVVAVATVPLFSGLAARWTEGRRVNASWCWGSGAAVAGCGILLLPGTNDRVDVGGVGCGVLAGALFAAYTVVVKRMASHAADVRITTGMSMLFGAALLSPLIFPSVKDLGRPHAVVVIAWLGLVTTAVAYGLYSRGLRLVSTTVAGALNLAEPLAAALLSIVFLGEQLSALEWLGCAVTLGGLLVAVLSGRNGGPSTALVLEPSVMAVGCVLMPRDVVLHPALIGSRLVRAVGRASAKTPGGSPGRTHSPGDFRPSNIYRDSAYAALAHRHRPSSRFREN